MNRWIEDYRAGRYEYNDLVEILSDYSKDVTGCRVRMWGKPAEEICHQLDLLDCLRDAEITNPNQYAEHAADLDAIHYGEVLGSRWG